MGFLEGWGNQKRWIVQVEDLENMYNVFHEEDTIKLWCDEKENGNSRKRKNDKMEEPNPRKKRVINLKQIFMLSLKHMNEYTTLFGQS